ncbi:hypothetical protein BD626DRAFT_29583 [Schizophyllum amplum]|uniref:Uncharacterized protein n=1 Tax=Schizophyllum amplum TaxID=97359 RepID=A0A550D0D0_9AGAR|nr:hypothetical protein BD626DRAFT_29583 [Auriculariopsis ampla]
MFIPFLSAKADALAPRSPKGGGGHSSSSSSGKGGSSSSGKTGSSSGGKTGSSSGGKTGSSSGGKTGSSSGSSSSSSSSGKTGSSSGSSSSSSSGGKTGSSSGSSSSSSSGGKSGSSSGTSSSSSSSKSISFPGSGSKSATMYGNGGGSKSTISSGGFAGRTQGGGTRSQIYGTSAYGSGYAGYSGRNVAGRNFPYYYWPLVFAGSYGAVHYIEESRDEYGSPSNTSRPGGALTKVSVASASGNTTLWVIADNSTSTSLVDALYDSCASSLSNTTSRTPTAFNDTPRAESVVQYYRASSVALTLDGYNDSAVLSADVNATATPLPEWRDTGMLDCVNETIGAAVPLVDANGALTGVSTGVGTSALAVVLLSLVSSWF